MKFHVTFSNTCGILGNGMVMHIKSVTLVSDIKELLPFCLNFNELVPT